MRAHEFTYKWLDFSDANWLVNNFAVSGINYWLALATQVFEKNTGHGAYSTNTLAWGRLITIFGTVFWSTRAERRNWQQRLQSIIMPEAYLNTTNRGFYEFSFKKDSGEYVKGIAKVYSDIRYEDSIDSPIIPFSFDIFMEDPILKSLNQNTQSWFDGYMGGFKFNTKFNVKMNDLIWEIQINNAWNWISPVRINVVWNVINPKIKNTTNGRRYWLSKETNNFIFDNTWEVPVVTDEGVNVKGFRVAWSQLIYLNPGVNTLILLSDENYVSTDVTFSVQWNDSYIN